MKNFQGWMDCQLYSSHLKNLQRIRQRALEIKSKSKNRKMLFTAHSSLSKSFADSNVMRRKQIKNKLCNSKSELQQSRIEKENFNLANRIINVPAVISKNKQLEDYRKYKSLFKKNSSCRIHEGFRDQKLKNFFASNSRNFTHRVHKSILRIVIYSAPKVPEGKMKTFWMEVETNSEKVISKHMEGEHLLFQQIVIPLKSSDETKLHISLHCSRGLEYLNLGHYQLELHSFNVKKKFTCVSIGDQKKSIEISVMREKVSKQTEKKTENLR